MKASELREITQLLPLPNWVMQQITKHKPLVYPDEPVIVSGKGNFAVFEIRDAQEFIQHYIYFRGFYEFRETRLIKQHLRPGDVFIDVGANIGWFTLLAANIVGESGKVIAFEPSFENYEHLKKNVDINPFTNINLEKIALSNQNGTVVLRKISSKNKGLDSIIESGKELGVVKTEKVTTIKLDDYLDNNKIKQIKFIKIDVEGAEMMVLQGMNKILKNKICDYLMLEVCNDRLQKIGSSSKDVISFLKGYGYCLFHVNTFGNRLIKDEDEVLSANIFAVANY